MDGGAGCGLAFRNRNGSGAMATTTWIAGPGDWNTASNWSNGVPTAADDAVFSTIPGTYSSGTYTVTGDGVAASLTIGPDGGSAAPTLTGTYTVGSFTDDRPVGLFAAVPELAATAVLRFGTGTISGTALNLASGARLEGGTLALSDGAIESDPGGGGSGTIGTLTGPLVLTGSDTVSGDAVLAGPVGGAGTLDVLGGHVVLEAAGSLAGGLVIGYAGSLYGDGNVPGLRVELAATGAAGSGPVTLGTGTLTLDPGVVVGTIDAATGTGQSEIDASDQAVTVFAGAFPFTYRNGDGHPTVIGATTPVPEQGGGEGPLVFGSMTVLGGTGSVTVFAGNEGGLFQGGSAGHNVLVAGPDLTGYPTPAQGFTSYQGIVTYTPEVGDTLVGGGDGDLLVSAGTRNFQPNVLVAGAGAETLTGSGSTANGFFFGGAGADLIALGAGYSVVVAGSGAETISGGPGTAAIFAGTGQDVILGGAGADYVQAGAGNATLFAGSGADLVGAVRGQGGGGLTVVGFRVGTDRLDLQGFGGGMAGIADSRVVGGGTALTLVDGTHVTLLGVTNLGAGSFV